MGYVVFPDGAKGSQGLSVGIEQITVPTAAVQAILDLALNQPVLI